MGNGHTQETRTDDATEPDVRATAGVHDAYRPTIDGERLIHVFKQLVEPIGRSLPSSCEVILHDLSRLPNSIVAIHGDVTGRSVGSPATDKLLRAAVSGELETMVGYETRLPDGRRLRSSTMVIRDVSDRPVAALCINSEVTVWEAVRGIAESMLTGLSDTASNWRPLLHTVPAGAPAVATHSNEVFVRDLDELAESLLQQAIDEAGVPVELMRKHHKIEIVRTLKARGMFLLRDAVETIAAALHVTRFTIYNYLNEIGEDADHDKDEVTA